MTATQTLSRNGWIRASVGGHWSQGPYTISTQTGGNEPSGYVVLCRSLQIGGRYPTLEAAIVAAERDAMRDAPKKGAAETYATRRTICLALLSELRIALDAHQTRQAQDPKNWGYAGDLAHYAQIMREMLEGMPKIEPDSLSAPDNVSAN